MAAKYIRYKLLIASLFRSIHKEKSLTCAWYCPTVKLLLTAMIKYCHLSYTKRLFLNVHTYTAQLLLTSVSFSIIVTFTVTFTMVSGSSLLQYFTTKLASSGVA